MKNVWKITNTTDRNIKFSISLGGANNPGIILKPGEMVLSNAKLTGPLDKQERSGFVEIDRGFDNSKFNLPIGKTMINIDVAIENTKQYSEK